MVNPFEAGPIKAAGRAHLRLSLQVNCPGLNPPDKKEHDVPPEYSFSANKCPSGKEY